MKLIKHLKTDETTDHVVYYDLNLFEDLHRAKEFSLFFSCKEFYNYNYDCY